MNVLTVIGVLILTFYKGGSAGDSFILFLLFFFADIITWVFIRSERKGQSGRISHIDRRMFEKGMAYSNGYEYEKYVAYLLENRGYRDVVLTKKGGDYGADIICVDKSGRKTAVQCKYYNKPVGYKAVEEAISGMHYYGCSVAIVITNSTYTKQAIEAAKRVGVGLYEKVR